MTCRALTNLIPEENTPNLTVWQHCPLQYPEDPCESAVPLPSRAANFLQLADCRTLDPGAFQHLTRPALAFIPPESSLLFQDNLVADCIPHAAGCCLGSRSLPICALGVRRTGASHFRSSKSSPCQGCTPTLYISTCISPGPLSFSL